MIVVLISYSYVLTRDVIELFSFAQNSATFFTWFGSLSWLSLYLDLFTFNIKIATQNATGSELWKKNSRRIWIKYHPIYFSVRCLPRLNIAVFCQNKTKNIVTTKFDGRPLAPTLARGMVQKSKLYYLHGRIMVHIGSKIFLKSLFYLY